MCIDDQPKSLTCPEGSIFYPEREQCDSSSLKHDGLSEEIEPTATLNHRRSLHSAFLRRPMGKQLSNRLKSLEDRVTALELKVNSTVDNHNITTTVGAVPTLNVTAEVMQQIGASINSDMSNENITGKTSSFFSPLFPNKTS